MLTWSEDNGEVWTEPEAILVSQPRRWGISVTSVVTQEGDLHLVWTENTLRRAWSGRRSWHAAIDVAGAAEVREVARSVQADEPTLGRAPTSPPVRTGNASSGTTASDRYGALSSVVEPKYGTLVSGGNDLSRSERPDEQTRPGVRQYRAATPADREEAPAPRKLAGLAGGGLHYATWLDGTWSAYETLWGGLYSGERPSVADRWRRQTAFGLAAFLPGRRGGQSNRALLSRD